MVTKCTRSTRKPRTCPHSWRPQAHPKQSVPQRACWSYWARYPRHCRLVHAPWILHSTIDHLVHHEAVDPTAKRERSDNAERDLRSTQIPPSTLDQASKQLEDMQHRLNLCIKTKQNVHPRTLVPFVIETLSAVIQHYRTIGNIWDAL